LNPYFKAARLFTPVGLGIAGVGQAYDFYKQYQDLQKLKEEDPEAYEKFRRSRVDDEITAQEIFYNRRYGERRCNVWWQSKLCWWWNGYGSW
jgi:hypothetical protein